MNKLLKKYFLLYIIIFSFQKNIIARKEANVEKKTDIDLQKPFKLSAKHIKQLRAFAKKKKLDAGMKLNKSAMQSNKKNPQTSATQSDSEINKKPSLDNAIQNFFNNTLLAIIPILPYVSHARELLSAMKSKLNPKTHQSILQQITKLNQIINVMKNKINTDYSITTIHIDQNIKESIKSKYPYSLNDKNKQLFTIQMSPENMDITMELVQNSSQYTQEYKAGIQESLKKGILQESNNIKKGFGILEKHLDNKENNTHSTSITQPDDIQQYANSVLHELLHSDLLSQLIMAYYIIELIGHDRGLDKVILEYIKEHSVTQKTDDIKIIYKNFIQSYQKTIDIINNFINILNNKTKIDISQEIKKGITNIFKTANDQKWQTIKSVGTTIAALGAGIFALKTFSPTFFANTVGALGNNAMNALNHKMFLMKQFFKNPSLAACLEVITQKQPLQEGIHAVNNVIDASMGNIANSYLQTNNTTGLMTNFMKGTAYVYATKEIPRLLLTQFITKTGLERYIPNTPLTSLATDKVFNIIRKEPITYVFRLDQETEKILESSFLLYTFTNKMQNFTFTLSNITNDHKSKNDGTVKKAIDIATSGLLKALIPMNL
jgi:hypothetical protein